MNTIRHNKMLGLAIGDKSMLVAEVSVASEQYSVTRVGRFTYGQGQSLQDPEALGKGLGQFLKENGFSTRRAVFGMPAKWVLTKPKEVPAADEKTAISMLRLQAETEFSPELKDLLYDFAGQADEKEETTVLLAATPQKHVDQIKAIAEAAKLSAIAITPSVAALAAATARVKKDALVLSLTPAGAELGAQHGTSPSVLRHVGPASAAAAPLLVGELRRAASAAPATNGNSYNGNGSSANGHSRRDLILWDDASAGEESSGVAACRTIGESAGLNVISGELSSLGVTAAERAADTPAGAVAVALALEGLQGRLPMDFLHSRLAPPKESAIDKRYVYGGLAAAILLLLVFLGWNNISRLEAKVDAERTRQSQNADRLKTAKAFIERVGYLENFRTTEPRFVSCLRDVTNLMPDDGQTFATTFTLHDTMKGLLSGKSSNGASVVGLLEKLNTNKHFHDVELLDMRESNNREVTFSISFVYDMSGKGQVPTPTDNKNQGRAPTRAGR